MPVIKLTLEIVNVFLHAGASAIGVGPLIPGLTLSEHQELLGVLKKDFDAVLKIERYLIQTVRSTRRESYCRRDHDFDLL